MATLKELFKNQYWDAPAKSTLYNQMLDKSSKVMIETRGLVNIPRQSALLASSPNTIADLIGNQLGGAIGGSANRPSDTIFKGKGPFDKPISLFKTKSDLRYAVEEDTPYFIKTEPAPESIISKYKRGATTPIGMAMDAGKWSIDNRKKIKGIAEKLKSRDTIEEFLRSSKVGEQMGVEFSKNEPIYDGRDYSLDTKKKNQYPWKVVGYTKREVRNWDTINDYINAYEYISDDDIKIVSGHYTYLKLKILGNIDGMYFPGTISGINETYTPEWNSYKYIGSPFKVHTYGGVERSLSFDFKLYCTNVNERNMMLKKLNHLTSMVYPHPELGQMQYKNDDDTIALSQSMFMPTFVFLTVKSFYNNLFGFVDNFAVSIDESTAWVNHHPDDIETDSSDNTVLNDHAIPSVINISFGMKILDTRSSLGFDAVNSKFDYNFRNNIIRK
jgi:hypothetical protein